MWSHHAPPSASWDDYTQRIPYDVLEPAERNVTVVWLREVDETLQRFVDDRHYNQGAFTAERLEQDRAALDRRTERWQTVFDSSRHVMTQLLDAELLVLGPRLKAARFQRCQQFPRVALPFFSWLTAHDPRLDAFVGEELRARRAERAQRV
ncbi:MAG: hypothetical protein CMH83_05920 [Nocardioides sp.]|nr:hypothetical protein [Nocardioides sp.]